MARLGASVRGGQSRFRRTGSTVATPPDPREEAIEENVVSRRYDNTAPVTLGLAEDTVATTRQSALEQALKLEGMGLADTKEYKNAVAIAERGSVDPQGKISKLVGALDWLDRPGHLMRAVVADVFGADEESEIEGEDYWSILKGDYETLAGKHGSLFGEDGRLVGGEILDAFDWETEAGETNWFNNLTHGLTGFALDVAVDPLTYVTGGAGGALKKTILTGANTAVERGVTRGIAMEFGEQAVESGARAAREGTETLAEEARKRLRTKMDEALESMDEIDDATEKLIRDNVHNEMLGEVIQPLAKKRFDELPVWFKEDTDIVGDWMKGGLRFGMGSRNKYGGTGGLIAGRPAQAREALGNAIRQIPGTGKQLDRLAKFKGRQLGRVNVFDPVVQGAKYGYEWAPQAVRLMAEAGGQGAAKATRALQQRAGLAMSKMANRLNDEAANPEEMSRLFSQVFRWTNDGNMLGVADEIPEHLQDIGREFVGEWQEVLEGLRREAVDVGILDSNKALQNYVPAITSQEFRKLANETAETGFATWDENAPEEIKEGLAWLNEMVQGIHRRVRGDQKVAGATEFASERTLGRGVEVTETGESFLFQFTDQVGPKYAGHEELNRKMVEALDWAIDRHNAEFSADPARRITKPKWLEEAVADPDAAIQGIMEMDPARVLQTYVRSMSQAINERKITQLAQEVGILSKNELSLDAAKVAYRIHEQFEGIVGTTQKRLAKRVEGLSKEQRRLTELAERTPPPRTMTKVVLGDGVEVTVPRKALDDPVVQERIKAAKLKMKAQKRAQRTVERAHDRRTQRLKALGVSDDAAEQFASAADSEVREIYRAVYMWQRVKMAEEMGINFEVLRTGIDDAMEEFRVHDKALAQHRKITERMVREVEEARVALERQWSKRQSGPRRVRFDSHTDRQMLQSTFRDAFASEFRLLSELLGNTYQTELDEIATLISRNQFEEANKKVKLFVEHTFSDGTEWSKDQVTKLRKSMYGKKRSAWNKVIPKEIREGRPFNIKTWDGMRKHIEDRLAKDGQVPEGFRDIWEAMQELDMQETLAARRIDEVYQPLMEIQSKFETWLWFQAKIEKADMIFAPEERKMLLQMFRKNGLLGPGQAVEWTPTAAMGFQIRDTNAWHPLPLRRVEREIKKAGFHNLDQARRAVDMASMGEDEWIAYQASAWGSLGIGDRWVAWGDVVEDPAERIAANWHGHIKNHWDRHKDPQVIQEFPMDDGNMLRWERSPGADYEDAIVWRDQNGELLGFISGAPRSKPMARGLKADDLFNGTVWVGIDPEANKLMLGGRRPIIVLREQAEEAFLPTFVGSGQTGYTIDGARSAWKSATKQTESLSDDVKESLLRIGDDFSASTYTVAEVELREARRQLRVLETEHADYAEKAVRFQALEDKMESIRRELNKRSDPMKKNQPTTAANWAKVQRELDEMLVEANRLRLGPKAQMAVIQFADEVERIRGLQSEITEWLGSRTSEAAMLRSTYFDGDAAAKNIRDLVNINENTIMNAGLDAYEEAIDTMGVLAERIQRILGYVDGPEGPQVTRYLNPSQAEELENLVGEARKLWTDTVGVEGNPFTGVKELWTPAPTRPGWAPSAAVNLGGEGVTGFGGDAQAIQFLDNLIGKHVALGTPEGFKEITGNWMKALNWWKTYATVVRAPFHVRNFISAMWANQLGDVRLQDYAGAGALFAGGKDSFFWKLMVRGEGIDTALDRVKDPRVRAAARAAYDEGMFFETFAEQEIAQKIIAKNKGQSVPRRIAHEALSAHGSVARGGGHAMQGVEAYHRFAAFLRMYEPEVPGSARDALSWVNTIHFDYSDLTSFERDFVKKYVPFYVWAKNNIPLQMRMIVERPGIINRYGHLVREVDNGWGGDEDPNLPGSVWRNTPYARFGDESGGADDFFSQTVFSPDIPVADLYDFGMTPTTMITYLANSLGPQFDVIKSGEADYQVNAPGSLNFVLNNLGRVGVFNESGTGLNRVSPVVRTLWSTMIPFGSDYVDPFLEMDPARLERLGQVGGVEDSTAMDSVSRFARKNVLGGLGISAEGGESAFRAATSASFELQDDYTGLRKTGMIDPIKEEAVKARIDELFEDEG